MTSVVRRSAARLDLDGIAFRRRAELRTGFIERYQVRINRAGSNNTKTSTSSGATDSRRNAAPTAPPTHTAR